VMIGTELERIRASAFCKMDFCEQVEMVKHALVRILSRHRGRVAYIRPKQIAMELHLARWAAVSKKIYKASLFVGNIHADGHLWRLERVEIRTDKGKEKIKLVYVRVN